jgi:biotin synthase
MEIHLRCAGGRFLLWPMIESHTPSMDALRLRGEAQKLLHERAMHAARQNFGGQVFVRAVVEVSNHCRENCVYCGMRRDNRDLSRYRASHDQLAELLIHHRPDSVTDVNLQAGEDPVAVREVVLPLLRTLRRETPLGLSVCLGTLAPGLYSQLKEAGASIYIMKFETADPARYAEYQAPGGFDERIQNIRHLAATGWHVSSGFIAGVPGQGEGELQADFALARDLPLAGCSVSPFIPCDQTPLAGAPMADANLALNCMAMLRLMRPDWIIPAVSALNLAEPGTGYRRGLQTGANLVTINLTPSDIRGNYLLYKRDRFIMTEERILDAVSAAGMAPSSQSLADFCRTGKRNAAHATQPSQAPV